MGFVGWMLATHDFARSVEVTTAVLIVTCPCAFGIATPLAYDLAQAGLRRAGLFVRSAGFLDRARAGAHRRLRQDGHADERHPPRSRPGVARERSTPRARSVLASMTAASTHPKSLAVHRALDELGAVAEPARCNHGDAGPGTLSRRRRRSTTASARRRGSPRERRRPVDVVFGANGRILADLSTEESLRPDAEERGSRAPRASGYDVWLLSGDDSARVAQTARAAGIREDHAIGGASAAGKGSVGRRPRPWRPPR